jgi:hypothetical protein
MALLFLSLALVAACRPDSGSSNRSDSDEIVWQLTAFVNNAFNGDATQAYALLSSETKKEYPKRDFLTVLTLGRPLLGGKRVEVARVENLTFRGMSATASLYITIAGIPVSDSPDEPQLIKENDAWMLVLDGNPCLSPPFVGFRAPAPNGGATPGVQVIPTRILGAGCDQLYPTVCIPSPPPILNCSQVPYRAFPVVGRDPHLFDPDKNGIGCDN